MTVSFSPSGERRGGGPGPVLSCQGDHSGPRARQTGASIQVREKQQFLFSSSFFEKAGFK